MKVKDLFREEKEFSSLTPQSAIETISSFLLNLENQSLVTKELRDALYRTALFIKDVKEFSNFKEEGR